MGRSRAGTLAEVRSIIPLVLRLVLVAAAVVATVACGSSSDEAPIASAAVTLTPSSAAGGSPIQVHYRLEAAPGATMPAGEYVVFVHWVDADGRMLWTDDHVPPVPLQQWRAGTPVEYRPDIVHPAHLGIRTRAGAHRNLRARHRRAAATERGAHERAGVSRRDARYPARPVIGFRGVRRRLVQPRDRRRPWVGNGGGPAAPGCWPFGIPNGPPNCGSSSINP